MSTLATAEAREVRAEILRVLYLAYPKPLGETLLSEMLSQGLGKRVGLELIHQAVSYLEGHGRTAITAREDFWLAKITPAGIDFYESEPTYSAVEAAKHRLLRLRVLQALNVLALRAVHEKLILKYLHDDVDLDNSPPMIHRSLTYLVDVGFADWQAGPDSEIARITSHGIDYLEGAGDDILGVKRITRL